MPTTLSARDFLALANLVSEKGIRYFVETDANGQRDGLDLAGQLGLHAHVCDPRNAQTLAGLYPDADIYDGNAAQFLEEVLPKLDAPTFFWLKNDLEARVVEVESKGHDWFFEQKEGANGKRPIVIWSSDEARTLTLPYRYAHITIQEPGHEEYAMSPDQNRAALLRLRMFDLCLERHSMAEVSARGEWLPRAEDVVGVMPFVNEWKDKVEGFVVNCGAGRSRSAGVAAAISESLGLDPAIYYEAPFNPNPLIRRLVEESMKSNQCIPVDHWNQRVKVDGVFPDPIEEFDRTWVGPDDLKPSVYRSQSEKDTFYAIAVENEYNAPRFAATDIIVDIGANIGAFCKRAHLNGSREIYGFEPSKFYMEAAKANVGDLEGVSLHQLAVVRSDDKRKPQYFHDNGMSTMVDEGNPVENVSLDEILGDLGPVRFLKIDCEGAEWTILRTCSKLDRVQEIAGEYHLAGHYDDNVSVGALMGFLYDQGFTQCGFHKQADATGGFWAKR